MACEMCGKEGQMYRVSVEGTTMTVCGGCKTYGTAVQRLPTTQEKRAIERRELRYERSYEAPEPRGETILVVVNSYGKRIKEAREKRGLKQEELAKQLRLKESQLHKFESGIHKPDMETARVLEKGLGITLVEQHVEEGGSTVTDSGPMTIGDMIKTRKR